MAKKKKKLLKRARPVKTALKKKSAPKRKARTKPHARVDLISVFAVLLDIRNGIKRLVDLAEIEAQEKVDDTPPPVLIDDVDLGDGD